MPYRILFLLVSLSLASLSACGPDPEDDAQPVCPECPGEPTDPLITGPSVATDYELEIAEYMPRPILDEDNPLTREGIELGRRLFYDKIMGRDSAFACADCHRQERAFTDGRTLAVGVDGREGRRNAMSLVNLVFNGSGFNWDGSSVKLWEQAVHPVENMFEMDEDWANVLERIRGSDDYPQRFRATYGIDRRSEITQELVVKAIAQFESTIISADSHFDRVFFKNTEFFTEEEQLGADSLFFVENVPVGALHPGCGHCHNAPSFGDNRFKNNGLDDVASLDDFRDKGFGAVSGSKFDNGKFRTPTLRNIALTAPYMHDGRFTTLAEVVEHYADGGHGVENEDPNITGFPLTERKKRALVAFLNSLTDEGLLTDPRFSDPFE
ncbi:cytochrome-c peroxidase [Neolewinella antarctica]|uniref:Cytochrome c peroxidase n=1 Tax=Neolewinella antarctica TaxID=442734 RepID=A0ABX0XFZ4_9BACT|nr:cytochrome c peroxidase [Neolewinella antarctica]NJC27793.1 cytochrome c peroxidase [Neolewinella antarctica]